MQTPYDWITVAIFAGIVVLFLQRSVRAAPLRRTAASSSTM